MLDQAQALPHNEHIEQSVIASLLEDCSLIDRVSFLNVDDFYKRHHRELYKIMLDMHSKGESFDIQIIGHFISEREDLGGLAYLADIVKNNSTTRRIYQYAKTMCELSARRAAIKAYQDGIEAMMKKDTNCVLEIAKSTEMLDTALSKVAINSNRLTTEDLIEVTVKAMEESSQCVRVGVSTGIQEIDDRLGYKNLAFGEITIIGAASKNGKTIFANTIAARCDLEPDECLHIFSVEMGAAAMFNGIVSAICGVPADFYARMDFYQNRYESRFSEWCARWGEAANNLQESDKISIDGTKDVTMSYICSEMRKNHQIMAEKGKKLKVVFIDHAQRINYDTTSKAMTYAMGDDAKMLKNTADELGVAVVLLAQINENSKDRHPTSYDILDTSRLRHEMQAFVGLKIFREEGKTYFGIYTDTDGLRYADATTKFDPAYMQMRAGVINSLPEENKHWKPRDTNSQE